MTIMQPADKALLGCLTLLALGVLITMLFLAWQLRDARPLIMGGSPT